MADATLSREQNDVRVTAQAAVTLGEVWQMPDGRAAAYAGTTAATSGDRTQFRSWGQYVLTKAAGFVGLDGGRAFWDHSANAVTYKKVNDRDFYLGRFVGDAASADTTCTVNLNVDPPYDLDLARDPFVTSPVGTQALGGFLPPQRLGGGLAFNLTATSEAQKVDAISVDGFAKGANAIVEFAFRVPTGGSTSAVDYSIGVANATHATDADSIADSIFIHLDGGSTTINAESDDGTTEVAATSTSTTFTAGSTVSERVECWLDVRDPTSVKVYVNGSRVLSGTAFNVDAYAGPWYLLVHLEKTSGTATADLVLDWMRARYSEQ